MGAQVLRDLSISSIKLLTSTKWNYVGLGGSASRIGETRDTRRIERDPVRLNRIMR